MSKLSRQMTRLGATLVAVMMAFGVMALAVQSAWAADAQEAQRLVEKAHLTLETFLSNPQMGPAPRTAH